MTLIGRRKSLLTGCIIAAVLALAGCASPAAQPQAELMVFASASLTQALTELGGQFEAQNPGVKVSFNFQNANTLAQQIAQGAPADVFASAAEKFMADAVDTGRVDADGVQVFARNRMVVIFPEGNPAGIRSLGDLVKPGIRLVVGAREGPQGIYVEGFLDKVSRQAELPATYKEDFYRNVVSYESTANAVVTKVALGEADAGIAFFSDSQGSAVEKVDILEIPDALNVEARYPIAPLNDSQYPELAKAFVDYVRSAAGQAVLSQYGFLAP